MILEMLEYDFMRRAIVAAAIMGPMCALLGVFITLRGMSFFSDAVAHSAVTGIALGLLFEQVVKIYFGLTLPAHFQTILLVVYCLGIALLMAYLFEKTSLRPDTIIAFCFTGSVAFGVLVISKLKGYRFLEGALFGEILANSWNDVLVLFLMALVSFGFIFGNLRALTLTTLQEDLARSDGLPTRKLNYLLVLIVAGVVAFSIKLLGALLVSALIVIPAAAAKLVAPNFRVMLLVTMVFGFVAATSGVIVSYPLETPTSPTIVLVNVAMLLGVMVFKKAKGKINKTRLVHHA